MIDLKTGNVQLYKCMLCEKKGKTLFEEQLFYKTLPGAFNHLRKIHGLKIPEIKAGTPKLWTHYLKYIQYILTGEDLENLRKFKKTREKYQKAIEIVKNHLKAEEIRFPPSLRFSHDGTPNSND